MDLDDLLNDIDIHNLPTVVSKETVKKVDIPKLPKPQVDTPKKSVASLVSPEIKPWLAYSANVPKELREKWTKMANIDTNAQLSSPFDKSTAYRHWEASTSANKAGIGKCLQELVRNAGQRCDLNDAQIAKILNLVNPVTDSENGPKIQAAFARQLMKDLSSDILSDPNYDPDRYPSLSMMLLD
mmetsp:Transcript_16561/g.22798  ORF Transcript_16561/g.22798 Transcript_16561/m.22798 type:complete len:184 (-) Transcript_16561:44-595(-)